MVTLSQSTTAAGQSQPRKPPPFPRLLQDRIHVTSVFNRKVCRPSRPPRTPGGLTALCSRPARQLQNTPSPALPISTPLASTSRDIRGCPEPRNWSFNPASESPAFAAGATEEVPPRQPRATASPSPITRAQQIRAGVPATQAAARPRVKIDAENPQQQLLPAADGRTALRGVPSSRQENQRVSSRCLPGTVTPQLLPKAGAKPDAPENRPTLATFLGAAFLARTAAAQGNAREPAPTGSIGVPYQTAFGQIAEGC